MAFTQATAMSFSTLVAPGAGDAVWAAIWRSCGDCTVPVRTILPPSGAHADVVRVEIPRAMKRVISSLRVAIHPVLWSSGSICLRHPEAQNDVLLDSSLDTTNPTVR